MACLTHRDARSPTFATCSKVQRVQGGAAHIPGRVRYTQVSGDMRTPTSCGVVRGAWCVLVRGGVALFAWSRGFLGGRALDLDRVLPPIDQIGEDWDPISPQIDNIATNLRWLVAK